MADKKYKLKFGMSDGTEKSVEFTAPQGEPGITPVVAVSDITGGHRVTITTGNNVQTIDVLDGKNGDPGDDGITPTVSVTEIEGGHRVTITTGSNVQSFDVLDGKDGEGGGTAGAVAWENVTGKPFNESLTGTAVVNGDTLSWDGNLDAMPIVVTPNNYNKWIYVSDNVPTMEQIGAGHTLAFKAYNGSEININITPSESENYIYVGDIDGQYLYIIKNPCTVGSMVFERTGIYFYLDSKATIYTCRLTINGYTFTEMGSIKDAYIPQTIARKSDIPQGGGAQVQSDYNQHDATQPDYIKNRPFWPEWSPVLLSETGNFMPDYEEYSADIIDRDEALGRFVAPNEWTRYTVYIKDKHFSGTAVSGIFSLGGFTYEGIRIDVGRDDILVGYEDSAYGNRWIFIMPDSVINPRETTLVTVIEGDDPYNKLSVPDDTIDLGESLSVEGVSIVQDLTSIYEGMVDGEQIATAMYNALKSDIEITIDMDGAEITLTSSNIAFVENTSMMGIPCDMYMYSQAPLAVIVHAYDKHMLGLLDLKTLGMANITTKAIKVNYPGIFAPTVEAKKVPNECLPGVFVMYTDEARPYENGNTPAYANPECTSSYSVAKAKAAFAAGATMYVCVVPDDAAIANAHKGLGIYRAVSQSRFYKNSGGNEFINFLYLNDDMVLCCCQVTN